MEKLGRFLRAYREARDKSLRTLATSTGLDQDLLKRFEEGQERPKTAQLRKLSDALDVPLSILNALVVTADQVKEEDRDALETVQEAMVGAAEKYLGIFSPSGASLSTGKRTKKTTKPSAKLVRASKPQLHKVR